MNTKMHEEKVIYDFAKICRWCAAENSNMQELHNYKLSDIVHLVDFIRDVTGIEVSEKDGLPQKMCSQCKYKIDQFFSFVQACIRTDRALREYKNRICLDSNLSSDISEDKNSREYSVIKIITSGDSEQGLTEDSLLVAETLHSSSFELFDNESIEILKDDLIHEFLTEDNKYGEPLRQYNKNHITSDKNQGSGITDHVVGKHIIVEKMNNDDIEEELTKESRQFTINNPTEFELHSSFENGNIEVLNPNDNYSEYSVSFNNRTEYSSHLEFYNKKPFELEEYAAYSKNAGLRENDLFEQSTTEENTTNESNEQELTNGSTLFTTDMLTQTEQYNLFGNEDILIIDNLIKEWLLENDEYKCDKYSVSLDNIDSDREIHDKKSFECKECSPSSSEIVDLNVDSSYHIKNIEKPFACNVCGHQFIHEYLLKQHASKHSDNKPFSCDECKKDYLTEEKLRRHMRIHRQNRMKKICKCDICSKEFTYASCLAKHKKKHTTGKLYTCLACRETFRGISAFKYHKKHHTDSKRFTCAICNDTFILRRTLRVHMMKHKNKKPYLCDVCGKTFSQSIHFEKHQMVHARERPILCTLCGKRMSSTGKLKVHMHSHTGKKPYKCDDCDESCADDSILKKHRMICAGEKPYICDVCGKTLNRSDMLKTHSLIHRAKEIVKKSSTFRRINHEDHKMSENNDNTNNVIESSRQDENHVFQTDTNELETCNTQKMTIMLHMKSDKI